MKFFFNLILSSAVSLTAFAQTDTLVNTDIQQKYKINIGFTDEKMKVDGILDEETWKKESKASNFWQKWPNNIGRATKSTIVKTAFDDKYLYISARCTDTSTYIIQSLKRDLDPFASDGFAVVIDPINAKSNGFFFSVSPYNVQAEDLIGNSNFNELSFSWDNKWFSATKRYADHWDVEIAIPFKTLRFNPDKTQWGINFLRFDVKNNQYSSWTHISVQFNGYDLGWTGALEWQQKPKSSGKNISIIPFVTGSLVNDPTADPAIAGKFNGGLDAKVALGSALNLDLTINPDFSQIEVDQQVTNLTRFNIFLPERRTFFLENDDVFSEYGAPPFRPFYSRTIGLDANGNKIPILAGARVSGNLNKTLRIGVMNMQTGTRGSIDKGDFVNAHNFTATTFNQRIGARSSAKGYFLNKQATGSTSNIESDLDKFGRNIGGEYNYSNNAGNVNLWSGLHKSYKMGIKDKNGFYQLGGGYFGKNLEGFTDFAAFGKNYYTDMGFVNQIESFSINGGNYEDGLSIVRQGFKQWISQLEYSIRPEKGAFNQHRFAVTNFYVWRNSSLLTDHSLELSYRARKKNTSQFKFNATRDFTKLQFFTPLPSIKPLDPGDYTYYQLSLGYESDYRKQYSFGVETKTGAFYSGYLNQIKTKVLARVQPWGNFSLSYEFNDIRFDEQYGNTRLHLLNSRSEINFSNSLFWTTFLQYNTQRNNFNINSRIQYRYKPMSDLFLVYTDNYVVNPNFKNRDRAIVFKLNYWLTL